MAAAPPGRSAFPPIAAALGSLLVVGVGLYEARVGSLVGAAALVPLLPLLLPLAGLAPEAIDRLQHPFDAWTATGCMVLCCAWLYGWLWRVLGTSRERRERLVWAALAAWGGALAASRANWLVFMVEPRDPLASLLANFNASMVAMLGGMGDLRAPGWLSASIAGLGAAGALALRKVVVIRAGAFSTDVPLRKGRLDLTGWRVWRGTLVALGGVELMLVAAWALLYPMTWGYDQTLAEAAGLLVVAASTLLPPTIVVVAALHERGPPASPGGWALWPCAWCWATLVSIMAGVLTDFFLPTMTGAAFALVLPFYIADRIWLERRRRYLRRI